MTNPESLHFFEEKDGKSYKIYYEKNPHTYTGFEFMGVVGFNTDYEPEWEPFGSEVWNWAEGLVERGNRLIERTYEPAFIEKDS